MGRIVAGIIASFALAFVLVVGVEMLSNLLHPPPADFKGTKEEICDLVMRYPDWILGLVVILWSGIGMLATWLAKKIGGQVSGMVIAIILLALVATNVIGLPYTTWFKIAMPTAFVLAIAWSFWPRSAPLEIK